MPIRDVQKESLEIHKNQLLRIDDSDLYIYGDANSEKLRRIELQFRMCKGEDYCKTKEEIETFLKQRWVGVFTNRIRLDQQSFGSNSIVM
mmetsp:Transcript_9419/g.12816  ORF Transcript_9419/g.12816 Transcript_9419/m.12816 type:complete len:90 (+) Transcript_9419:82-351(+)